MHARKASVGRHGAHGLASANIVWQQLGQLANDVAQAVDLRLARNVSGDAAGVLDVLLPVQHLPDGLWLAANGVPQVHGEDQRVDARVLVEDDLRRRVGKDAAVPVQLAVDAHGRERRR